MEPNELAKARDGLLAKGMDAQQVDSLSQILRLTFYYGLLALCDEPKSPASPESTAFIKHRMNQNPSGSPTSLDDLMNANL
jgi:hypothetical protein